MFDPTQGKLDRDFDESMRMFEKALVKSSEPIEPRQPSKVLLALDGSSQDAAVVGCAKQLRTRFDAKILFLDARETTEGEADVPSLQTATTVEGAELLKKGEGPSYDQILSAVTSHEPDLVVLPCPFGRDFESIGAESAGTVIDVMLSRCAVPILIIRHPDQDFDAACKDISLLVSAESDAETEAAAWALGLVSDSGSVTLDVVVEKEQFENLKHVLEVIAPDKELTPDDLNKALADSHTELHAAIQSVAFEAGVRYQLVPKANETAPPLLGEESRSLLMVLPFEVDDRFVHGFVHDRVRRSPHPVLIVTTHVKQEEAEVQ